MGAGHIGSTILDIVLGSYPQMESLGEISKFHQFGWEPDKNRKCSCGVSVYDCPFWSQVRDKWTVMTDGGNVAKQITLQKKFEGSRFGWARLLRNRVNALSSEFSEYMRGTEALYRAVHIIGRKEFLIDSSLSPRRAYGLTLNPNIDLHLIHLVRDGRGVIWSLKKPAKKSLTKVYKPAPASKTVRYWISANLQSAYVFNQVKEEKRQLIRYEDFVLHPNKILNNIGDWIGQDLSRDGNELEPNKFSGERHTVAGNRIRMQRQFQIRPDFAWMEELSEKDRKLFWRTAGWLARQYRYENDQTEYILDKSSAGSSV